MGERFASYDGEDATRKGAVNTQRRRQEKTKATRKTAIFETDFALRNFNYAWHVRLR